MNEQTNKFEIAISDTFDYDDACREFTFCVKNPNDLIFLTRECKRIYNYKTKELKETPFKNELAAVPTFFCFNED